MNEFKEYIKQHELDSLVESGLSRIYDMMKLHDCGIITAFRSYADCGKGERYSISDNRKRNKLLLAKLQDKRYGVTNVQGAWIENMGTDFEKSGAETSFFVVDLNDNETLEKDLQSLGEEFEQEAILWIPKGGESATFIGTNHCSNTRIKYGEKQVVGKRFLGKKSEFFTSISNRPFVFENIKEIQELVLPEGFFSRWVCNSCAKKKWQDMKVDEN